LYFPSLISLPNFTFSSSDIERRLKKETRVTDNQFGFMFEMSTMDVIYLLWLVMERY